MSILSLQSSHAEALELFQEGRLQQCRETVEDILQSLSQDTAGGDAGEGAPSPAERSSPTGHQRRGASEGPRHALFSNCLLLLSGCYSAVGSFSEAERLLATCQGYVEENRGGFHPTPSIAEAAVNQALATIAYSRAAVRLELYRTQGETPVSVVEEADECFLAEAERRLDDVLGPERLLLADVWHCRGVCCEILAGIERADRKDEERPERRRSDGGAAGLPLYVKALECYTKSMDVRARYADVAAVTELKLALTMEHVAHLLKLSATPADPGRKEEALALLGTVAATRRRLLGPRHPLLASTLLAEGALLAELGRYKRAKRAFADSLAIVSEVYPPGDARVAEVEYWLSRVQ